MLVDGSGLFLTAVVLAWALTGLAVRVFAGERHLAAPNARSMHSVPVPCNGGLAIVTAVVVLVGLWTVPLPRTTTLVLAAAVALSLISWLDHARPLWPATRLSVQALAVAMCLSLLPDTARIITAVPFAVERIAIALAWLWLINLTNFMDGIDGIAGAEGAAVALGYVAVVVGAGVAATTPLLPVALALAGACLGYLIWNWHPARIFMGDPGSIPLGFLLGWLMLDLALRGAIVAAAVLPLAFVADATLTLLRRLSQGKKPWQAHRSHFYQRAVQGGASPRKVVTGFTVANVVLIGAAVLARELPVSATILALVTVGVVLARLQAVAGNRPAA
jgi:UDP-N-acetylmuramyl pentapeptide phosphotransferase/UDP-N-acetylglucosamine-1-phosphate transferase